MYGSCFDFLNVFMNWPDIYMNQPSVSHYISANVERLDKAIEIGKDRMFN